MTEAERLAAQVAAWRKMVDDGLVSPGKTTARTALDALCKLALRAAEGQISAGQEVDSRSRLRRIAAQKGEPIPTMTTDWISPPPADSFGHRLAFTIKTCGESWLLQSNLVPGLNLVGQHLEDVLHDLIPAWRKLAEIAPNQVPPPPAPPAPASHPLVPVRQRFEAWFKATYPLWREEEERDTTLKHKLWTAWQMACLYSAPDAGKE